MKFILSAILASALLSTLTVADVHQNGHQAAFHLTPRHVQSQNHVGCKAANADHSHHRASHKKQRRDIEQALFEASSEQDQALDFHGKKSHHHHASAHHHSKSHHKKNNGHKGSKRQQHHHHQHVKRELNLHRKKSSSHHKAKGNCQNHVKRAENEDLTLGLHRKNPSSGGCSKHPKRALDLHRKKSRKHRKIASSCGMKHSKRALDLHRKKTHGHQKHHSHSKHAKRALEEEQKSKKVDEAVDSELAFHRKISRNRKHLVLGGQPSKKLKGKKHHEKRHVPVPQDQQGMNVMYNNQEFTLYTPEEEPLIEAQDVHENVHRSSSKKVKAKHGKHLHQHHHKSSSKSVKAKHGKHLHQHHHKASSKSVKAKHGKHQHHHHHEKA
ncbi:hypothetical protein BGW38_007916 [Lunasporangiospora selenospora]|uniref:Uncharacterized protein n=1 Tax=Lunasporangiospora selenospora TaxID=979761 RepID=A0A9P6FKU6_9FUNG|nr:hypothetical protein BGW38_007916 [Lunasporangiospora selenospora]